jgi:transketolase
MSRTQTDWVKGVRQTAIRIRRRVLHYAIKNNGGYISQACSSAEVLATLYQRVMTLGPSVAPAIPIPFAGVPRAGFEAPNGGAFNGARDADLDRFIFSPVHYALVLYSVLIEVGRLDESGLLQFNQDGSTVEMIGAEHSPGIELTAGSLAQALSQAGGIALARRLKRESGHVWIFMSDGEFQEGQTWEALAALSHHRLDNLTALVDVNGRQCDGAVASVMTIEPLAARIAAFGVSVSEVDAHDPAAIASAAQTRAQHKPRVVLCRSDPYRGIDVLRKRDARLHHVRFSDEQERQAYQQAYEALGARLAESERSGCGQAKPASCSR